MNQKTNQLRIKYRTWYKGIPPKPIKLKIPGWAGDSHGHSDGDKPQPWHCPPFVDGSTYGLELVYPFDTEVKVVTDNDKIVFQGDFSAESKESGVEIPPPGIPFQAFAPGHFGFTSSLDLEPPPGYVVRLESHPRLYTSSDNTVPLVVPGHIQGEWWPKFFFVVFKAPMPGQTYVFRKDEPYAQIMIVPKKVAYEVIEMTQEEQYQRGTMDDKIVKYGEQISEHSFKDHLRQGFNDKYKILKREFNKGGLDAIDELFQKTANKDDLSKKKMMETARKKFKKTLVLTSKTRKIR